MWTVGKTRQAGEYQVADRSGAAGPALDQHVFMIAADDADGDCHVVFTESAVRAIAHYKQMSRIYSAVRGNENFEYLRPLITTFEEDAMRFGP